MRYIERKHFAIAFSMKEWEEFNSRHFDGELRPVPLVLIDTEGFGQMLAFCSYAGSVNRLGHTITLKAPKRYRLLAADNHLLLHEMIHQLLFERGENAAHEGEPWRREIMRLHKLITGEEIWAGRSQTVRRNGKVVSIDLPHPETGVASLTQLQIAHWPSPSVPLGDG